MAAASPQLHQAGWLYRQRGYLEEAAGQEMAAALPQLHLASWLYKQRVYLAKADDKRWEQLRHSCTRRAGSTNREGIFC